MRLYLVKFRRAGTDVAEDGTYTYVAADGPDRAISALGDVDIYALQLVTDDLVMAVDRLH